jgi:hypothetical protein
VLNVPRIVSPIVLLDPLVTPWIDRYSPSPIDGSSPTPPSAPQTVGCCAQFPRICRHIRHHLRDNLHSGKTMGMSARLDARRNAPVMCAHIIEIVGQIDLGRVPGGRDLCRSSDNRPAQSLQKIRAGNVIPGRNRNSDCAQNHRQISSASHPARCASCRPVWVAPVARTYWRPSGGRR